MISEFLFRQVVSEARNKIERDFPFLKSNLSEKELWIKHSSSGKRLFLVPNVYIYARENHQFFLSNSGNKEESNVLNSILNIFLTTAEKKNIDGFIRCSFSDKVFPIGKKAEKILTWIQSYEDFVFFHDGTLEIDPIYFSFPRNVRSFISFEGNGSIDLVFRKLIPNDPEIFIFSFQSKEDIDLFFNQHRALHQRLLKKGELIRKNLLTRFSSVQPCDISSSVKIFGKRELVFVDWEFSKENKGLSFYSFIQDRKVEHESLEAITQLTIDEWSQYIKRTRLRKLLNVTISSNEE